MEIKFHQVLRKDGYLLSKKKLDSEQIKKIKNDLTVMPMVLPAYRDFVKVEPFNIYQESLNYLFTPRFYGENTFGPPIINQLPEGAPINLIFTGQLKPYQLHSYDKTLKALQTTGGGVLSLPCGYGKTIIAIKLAIDLQGKTLVVVNKECLMDQWAESISKFTNGQARIGIIQQSTMDVQNKDFVLAMLHSLSLRDYPKEILADFRSCIVDEAHHISSEVFSRALPKVTCRYTLGLSATPNRKDGLSYVFYQYLGPLCHSEKRTGKNQVIVKRLKLLSNSPYYQVKYMSNGIKNTSAMVTSLAQFSLRTSLIIECIKLLLREDRKILLLSGRREHLEQIYQLLTQSEIYGIDGKKVTFGFYYGNVGQTKKQHRAMLAETAKCQVVLGTNAIAAEGLDLPDLNTEIMATPMAEVEQAVGRILRKFHDHTNPMVIDIIDNFANFPQQAKVRHQLYNAEDYQVETTTIDIDQPQNHINETLNNYLTGRTTFSRKLVLKNSNTSSSRSANSNTKGNSKGKTNVLHLPHKCLL